jgi:hypothetical protein
MPWRNTAPMDQRTQFIADHLRETRTITELCDRYGISRKIPAPRARRPGGALAPAPSRPQ